MPALRTQFFPALRVLLVGGCLGLLACAPVRANPYDEVDQLTRAGKWDEALSSAERHLQAHPRDPQMRLLRGVVLNEQGRSGEAMAVYQKLAEDFPELPESYNNMAVIYAAQNQFDKARAALDMATRANPAYASAFENLGDVYARLAAQAYAKASQLQGNPPELKSKMNALRDLFQLGHKAPAKAAKPTPGAS